MSKITVGKTRKSNVAVTSDHHREGNFLFAVGIVVMCIMIALPMRNTNKTNSYNLSDATPVMSSGVMNIEREELSKPDKVTSAEDKWSIYDYIGEMFADLIFGDR